VLEVIREVGLEVNKEKIFCHQNVGQNYSLLVAYKSFENMA
jgi:hypothetical protein